MSSESLEAKETEAEKIAVETNNQVGSLIYLGPNLPGSMLNRFTVYRNGKPKHLEKVFADCPDIERLFVPVEKLSETLDKINKAGTPYNGWYANVAVYTAKGVR